jgi:nucleoid-associated protein YgaU
MPPRASRRAFVGAALGLFVGLASACTGNQAAVQPTAAEAAATTTPAPPPRVPSPSPSPSPSPASGPGQLHTVEAGDTLASIAQQYYGDAAAWRKIFDANKAAIGENPDNIKIGMQLKIPPKD